ncbi:mechanosensitive ion channel protein 2, chloroplastic-like [Sesamum indicum]|uniref:Mechanosensitive ion channel protein 2, chloroplastic-like n=1 Tax=Sesamum indicum TaxID=4182 RepID=A0A6I9UGA1_SESIN|nr:mechanosensitive ion channel protein 2, chloroplastic-like [Sesamum indicum]
MMAISSSLQPSLEFGICSNHGSKRRFLSSKIRGKLSSLGANLSSVSTQQYSWSTILSKRIHRRVCTIPCRNHQFKCCCFLNAGPTLDATSVKNFTLALARSFNRLQGSPIIIKLASAMGIVVFAIWGLGPLVQQIRNIFLKKGDSSWQRSGTYHVTSSYIQPLLLWTGAIFFCKELDLMILPSEGGQIVKQRVLNFVRSLSTVLAFAHCLSSVIQQAQKFFMETNDPTDTRNMGFQFAGRAVYTAVSVAAVSLFMELLGFSTQKWITAGGLGTVLLTLAGREILTNFLSSVMIHATRPFILNEWIQTKISGYEVSGTVEHVGWWSPTIVRGDDREAVHIPNHKFTVNIVRNLSQKTHWRIKTHLAISHLDVGKVNNIVADMRKVLAKNPQVEQQKLHRRVFLDNIDPENQALLILVSCFVKTSRFEEYLCVKEAILLDLLRVITHHRARLATPIRTVQKVFTDADLDGIPFSDSVFTRGAPLDRPLLLIEPSYKISGDDKIKTQARAARANGDEENKAPAKPMPYSKVDAEGEPTLSIDTKSQESELTDNNTKETATPDAKPGEEFGQKLHTGTKDIISTSDPKLSNSTAKSRPQEGGSSSPQLKQDVRQPVPQAPATKPSLEENIVLGVALEGSKRTLPIEEDMPAPSNPEETKELAALLSSNGPAVAEKEKSDAKRTNMPSSPPSDPSDQQE